MVRDEADIIEVTVRHLRDEGVDRVLIADNLSRDGTRELLDDLGRSLPIDVVDDADPAYRQSEKMTELARRAAAAGADWIIPFDADEIWRARRGTIRDAVSRTDAAILAAPLFDHYSRPTFRRGTPVETMCWNRHNGLAKVAFKWSPDAIITFGNHFVEGVDGAPDWTRLLIDHYPFRSWPQYYRKIRQGVAALDAAGAAPTIGSHWRRIGYRSDWRIRLSWLACRLYPKLRRRDARTA